MVARSVRGRVRVRSGAKLRMVVSFGLAALIGTAEGEDLFPVIRRQLAMRVLLPGRLLRRYVYLRYFLMV